MPRFGERARSTGDHLGLFRGTPGTGPAENIGIDAVPYVLRGKLAGGLFGTQRFVEKGTIDLSPALTSPIAAPESYDHITKNATILRQRSVRWRHRANPPPANSSTARIPAHRLYRSDLRRR